MEDEKLDEIDEVEEEKSWKKFLAENYVETSLAKANPKSKNPNNLGGWVPETKHRDTACPLTRKERLGKKLEFRWPDAVGIGFPKCGTAALSFIDCHSKLVFRLNEPAYWTNKS